MLLKTGRPLPWVTTIYYYCYYDYYYYCYITITFLIAQTVLVVVFLVAEVVSALSYIPTSEQGAPTESAAVTVHGFRVQCKKGVGFRIYRVQGLGFRG